MTRAADILALDALTLRDRIASGALKAVEVADAYNAQIAARDGDVRAFAWHDPAFVRRQAEAMDSIRRSGRPLGALHGVPVAVKDIIDTAAIPTENGSPVDKGRVPEEDAFVVTRLKAAGALILGKTMTTELAFLDPPPTRNPHDPAHTPGGSSSGSAAAVASQMAPLAIGTQTGGSVVRPAAFCGVVGFKPSFGVIPRTGILEQSVSLDTVGVFARNPVDASLLAEVLAGYSERDTATRPQPTPPLLETTRADPPVRPTLAFVRLPGWDEADADMRDGLGALLEELGEQVFEAELPGAFADAALVRQRINEAEMARAFRRYARHGEVIGPKVRAAIERGTALSALDYLGAKDWQGVLAATLGPIFSRADAIICPAAPGPAPRDLGTTGDSIFNGVWTMCGMPAVTLPMLAAGNGMPMGVQLVGAHGNDGRLMRTARWLFETVANETGDVT